MLDESEFERDDTAAPIDMLESYFAAHGWKHERQDEEVVAHVKGSWTEYELRGLWREEDSVLQFLAFPDIKVTEERRGAIYEAIVDRDADGAAAAMEAHLAAAERTFTEPPVKEAREVKSK